MLLVSTSAARGRPGPTWSDLRIPFPRNQADSPAIIAADYVETVLRHAARSLSLRANVSGEIRSQLRPPGMLSCDGLELEDVVPQKKSKRGSRKPRRKAADKKTAARGKVKRAAAK